MRLRRAVVRALVFAAVLHQARCAATLPLEDRPCPCTAGYSCCESTQRCVTDLARCAAVDGGGGEGGAADAAPCGAGRTPCGKGECCLAARAVAAGEGHTCALMVSGGVKCWGNGRDGQLGNGETDTSVTPVDVRGLDGGVATVLAGSATSCVLTDKLEALCWGSNQLGLLGTGTRSDSAVPVRPKTVDTVRSLAISAPHVCAVDTAAVMHCWGSNNYGELGTGTTSLYETSPRRVVGLGILPERAFVGGSASCAADGSGRVECWGAIFSGANPTLVPKRMFDLRDVEALAISRTNHACVLRAGEVSCWGDNTFGAVGEGGGSSVLAPLPVRGLPTTIRSIGVGSSYSCALSREGRVLCWGGNTSGTLGTGDGSLTKSPTPVQPEGLGSGVAVLSVGNDHACVVTTTGAVKCWGNNVYGQLGIAEATGSRVPVDVTGLR